MSVRTIAQILGEAHTPGKNSVYFGGAHGATHYAPVRIAFTRIPRPELEEIDESLGRRIRPLKVETPVDWENE